MQQILEIITSANGNGWSSMARRLQAAFIRMRSAQIRQSTHILVATLLFCGAVFAYTSHMPEFHRFFSGINDFLPRYTQAESVRLGNMYDIESGYRAQERATGFHIVGAYHDRLPWQALLMAPLGLLPYKTAYWIWITCNVACFACLVRFWLLPRNFVLWGVVFFPAAASIIVGQEGLVLAMCLAGAILLANKGRDIEAGVALALCAAKPHLFLLVPVALLAHRRWKIIAAAGWTSAALLAAGTAVAGLDWVKRWIAIVGVLGAASGGDVPRRPTLFQFGVNEWTVVGALLLAVLFGFSIWRTKSVEVAVSIAVVGSVLIAPHTSVYDLPLLLVVLPALPLVGVGRWLRISLLTPLPYWALLRGAPWNSALVLLLVAVLPAVVWAESRERSLPPPRRKPTPESDGGRALPRNPLRSC